MELSVVVPVYNEEKRIRKTLSRLSGYLRRYFSSSEIVVVDNGSKDKTREILREVSDEWPLHLIQNEANRGKGFAVREGVLAAKGDLIFFTDADLSTPVQEIGRFVRLFREGRGPVLIGSRSVPSSIVKVRQACYRQNMGRVFNWLVKRLTPLRFEDTQCGFKGFTREAALKIFRQAQRNGFAFDVEILILAKRFGFKAEEIPVTWVNNSQSKVNPLSDSFKMFWELFDIARASKKQAEFPGALINCAARRI